MRKIFLNKINGFCLIVASFVCFSVLTNTGIYAINNDSAKYIQPFDIKLIGILSTSEIIEGNKGFLTKVKDFIFGKDVVNLVKPTNLIALDTNRFLILDHGLLSPVLIDKGTNKFIALDHKFNYPSLVGTCLWKDDRILYTDSKLNKIYYYKSGQDKPFILNDSLELKQPTGIAYSITNDEIWVSETANHRILVLDSNGKVKREIGSRGSKPGEFNFPTFLWIDTSGMVYVVDALNFRLQILNLSREVVSVFGEPGDATGYMGAPKGVATDTYGNIYIVDAIFHTVQIFDKKGNFLYYFGKQGSEPGEFWMPSGIYIDKTNRIYVADCYNSRIQIFQLLRGENK